MPTVHAFFNVSSSVGKHGANIDLDVMLVQYMLWNIMVQGALHFTILRAWKNILPTEIIGTEFQGLGPEAIYPVDGVYQKELDTWVLSFQIIANHQGFGPLIQDSRVDPSPIGWGLKSRSKTVPWRTIQALNLVLSRKCNKNAYFYSNLPNFSDVPPALRQHSLLVQLPDS